ncbi:MAG TPA: LLM class F420-dependent oxidoreductase [Gammaproteobacteria bacterium]|nr:LLM class F420-dependent oxidoreductase [Gammaproteobacteria bacterium]
MHFDALFTPTNYGNILAEIEQLDHMGVDCMWTVESGHNPFIPLTLAAAHSKRLEIGTNIAVAFARTPFSMAQTAWDLQRISQGKFRLGMGTQVRAHVERRLSMPFDHPAARITDYVRCVRAIWDNFQYEKKPDYQGPFYQFTLMNYMFTPGPIDYPMPKIYLAGVNPRMVRAAGECADGFHIHPMHSIGYIQDVIKPALAEGTAISSRAVDDLELYAPVFVITGRDQKEMDESEQSVRAQIAFYASTPSYRALLEYHGFGEAGKKLSALMRDGNIDDMSALVPDALVEEIAVIAKPGDLAQALKERYSQHVDRISLYNGVPDCLSSTETQALVADVTR